MNVIGIDAAWTEKQPSGICSLKTNDGTHCEIVKIASSYNDFIANKKNVFIKPMGSKPMIREILDSCGGEVVDCIAVDMPLSNEPISGRRSCENAISSAYASKGAPTHTPSIERQGKISIDIFYEANELSYELALESKKVLNKAIIEMI